MSNSRLRDERGAILPIVAAALVMALIVGALVIDIANWFEHGKSLQIRVDNAALAGGQQWSFPCEASTNDLIESTARQYVGSHMDSGGTLRTEPYNNLITTTKPTDVHVLFNSLSYFEDGGADWTDRSDPNDAVTAKPCSREYLDVKITEDNVGGFFGRFAGLSFLPSLSRKARVQLFEVDSLEGLLPIGVKAFDARSGGVLFVNPNTLDTVQPIAKKYLVKDPDGDSADSGNAPDYPEFVRWANDADPNLDAGAAPATGVTVPAAGVEAVIAMSSRSRCGQPGVVPPCFDLNVDPDNNGITTTHEICNQGDTTCFTNSVSGSPPVQTITGGLSHIASFNPSLANPGPTGAPVVRNVYVEKAATAGCRDGYFVYGDGPCDLRLVADIGFDPSRADNQVEFHVHDAAGWCGSNGCALTRNTTLNRWVATIPVPEDPDVGPNPLKLEWAMKTGSIGGTACGNNFNTCTGGFINGMGSIGAWANGTAVHSIFGSSEVRSGPIEIMRVWNNGNAAAVPPVPPYTGTFNVDTNSGSYPVNSTQSLYVDIFLSNVVATDPSDPPIALRVTGSQNGTIDCDPNLTFPEEFAQGCKPRYAANKFTTTPPCPAYNVLWTLPQPWTCVKTQTGVSLGNVGKGLKDRVLGGGNGCLPDNDATPGNYRNGWNWWNNGLNPSGPPTPGGSMFPNFDPTDKRLVSLFITPFGSFTGSGNAIFPISGFGAFYITGWSIQGQSQDPCPGADPAPDKFLMGHFIKDVIVSGATPSHANCNPASLTPCVVALVE